MFLVPTRAPAVLEPTSQDLAGGDPRPPKQVADPLGPLALLPGPGPTPGVWRGHGFNAIWLPQPPSTGQHRFLALTLTNETITFTRIDGEILNRGLATPDIAMHGVTYLQQSNGTGDPTVGLHTEPGIWATVPPTSDPAEPATVVRMASIPHGTVINAQGVFQVIKGGPQRIPETNLLPFPFDSPAPRNHRCADAGRTYPELDLSIPSQFRSVSNGVTQETVCNPNSLLEQALHTSLHGTTMKTRTALYISTTNSIIQRGGGTANIAFLASSNNPAGGNAEATSVEAIFWIETIAGAGGNPDLHQLQYTQRVMLDFNGVHWPHVTVGTLRKQ